MVGAADVTNGVKGEEKPCQQRGDRKETKVIVSVIETSKGSPLESGERASGKWKKWHMCPESG